MDVRPLPVPSFPPTTSQSHWGVQSARLPFSAARREPSIGAKAYALPLTHPEPPLQQPDSSGQPSPSFPAATAPNGRWHATSVPPPASCGRFRPRCDTIPRPPQTQLSPSTVCQSTTATPRLSAASQLPNFLTAAVSSIPSPPPRAASTPPGQARARQPRCRCWRTGSCPSTYRPPEWATPDPSED
jgi:hypothetical protein